MTFVKDARSPTGVFTSGSLFVPLLQYMEQQPLFDAVNFDVNIFTAANSTVHATGVSTLWCPSDPKSMPARTLPDGAFLTPGPYVMNYTSYAGNSGTWLLWFQQDPVPQSRMNGLFYIQSAVTLASITDGTSHTLAFGERAHGLLDDESALWWHWWTSSNYGDTMFCTLFPMNPFRKVSSRFGSSGDGRNAAYISGSSSLHPGGGNFAFMDGSVRFLKETIQTWPYDPITGMPTGVTFDPAGPYAVAPGTRIRRLPEALHPERRGGRRRRQLLIVWWAESRPCTARR